MLELIPKKTIRIRQEERIAEEIANELGNYFEKVKEEYVLTGINEALTQMSKRDTELAQLILKSLKEKHPKLDFKIKS